ncbi:MAG: acyl-CoA dehydrogenase family protein, partial [Chloroflexota bacterium]|nr:acyl-CoA dehydrogenase family protein [Chloroflexota bacterium]
RGDRIICLALTEPGCGSDAAALTTRAVREGDHYVLSGEKTSITQGMQADAALLFAKTDPAARARGVSCFLVPLDLPGVVRSRLPSMGFRPLMAASIILDGVRVPARYRMGEEGRGFHMVMGQFDFIRPCLGLASLGAAQASLEEAIAYAKQRTAFGQPIGKFEGVSFKIAEHLTRVEAARWLCYRTLWLRDQGIPHTKESAMCKWLCPEVAVQAIHDALLLHGHLGYSEEYPIEQRLRDVIGLEIGDGTAQIMKLIITREVLGREFLPY